MLIDWVSSGRTGKYLALGQDVRTSLRSVLTPWPRAKYLPVRPSHSVNNYIIFPGVGGRRGKGGDEVTLNVYNIICLLRYDNLCWTMELLSLVEFHIFFFFPMFMWKHSHVTISCLCDLVFPWQQSLGQILTFFFLFCLPLALTCKLFWRQWPFPFYKYIFLFERVVVMNFEPNPSLKKNKTAQAILR